VTLEPEADADFSPLFAAEGGIPSADPTPGTKLAKPTTNDIIAFCMATLTCGYGDGDPYSGKGLRPFLHVVQ